MPSSARFGSPRQRLVIVSLAAALALGSCARGPMTTGSVDPNLKKSTGQMTQSQLQSNSRAWAQQYKRRPKDKTVGLNFAASLRMAGNSGQALAVMQQVVIAHPTDRTVLAAYGKALASTGNLNKALNVIQRAQTPDAPDWKLYSAEGAIYDQMGKPEPARVQYRKALDIAPNEPSVLSNLGMSYLLTGDLKSSETYLRNAISQPRSDSRIRQNLALAVGLQGRFGEAEKIAAGELDPAEAQANVAYLRQMLSQQNAWNQLKDGDGKKKKTN